MNLSCIAWRFGLNQILEGLSASRLLHLLCLCVKRVCLDHIDDVTPLNRDLIMLHDLALESILDSPLRENI